MPNYKELRARFRTFKKTMETVVRQARLPKLPRLILTEDGRDYPGYEAANALNREAAQEFRLVPKEYLFDAFAEEGIDP